MLRSINVDTPRCVFTRDGDPDLNHQNNCNVPLSQSFFGLTFVLFLKQNIYTVVGSIARFKENF